MTRLLRVVTLASATGMYGGPFDTAGRQSLVAAELGFDTVLLAGYRSGDRPATVRRIYRTSFVKVRPLLSKGKFVDLISFEFIRVLASLTRQSQVVHISFSRELIPVLSLIFALLLRKTCIVQSHGMLTSRNSAVHRIIDFFLRPLVKRATAVIALTEVEAEALQAWAGDGNLPITVLGNPVPDGLSQGTRSSPLSKDAVFIARLHQRKRVDVFLAAAEEANKKSNPARYVVVGPDGGCLDIVKSASSKLPNVVYEGAISPEEVTARVSKAGVFVLTSESEPWGNVLAIALASGVPVVVPSSAALASAVQSFGAGVVVADGCARQVANAISSLFDNPEMYVASSSGALELAASVLSKDRQRLVLDGLYHQV